jgi:hypothetical protein
MLNITGVDHAAASRTPFSQFTIAFVLVYLGMRVNGNQVIYQLTELADIAI